MPGVWARQPHTAWRVRLKAADVLALGLMLGFFAFATAFAWHQEVAAWRGRFYSDARDLTQSMQHAIHQEETILRGLASLLAATPDATGRQFATYTEPFLQQAPEVMQVAYLRRVPGPDQADHFPVEHVHPLVEGGVVSGLDFVADPERRQTLMRAARSRVPVAMRNLSPAAGRQDHLMLAPVYREPGVAAGEAERLDTLRGFVAVAPGRPEQPPPRLGGRRHLRHGPAGRLHLCQPGRRPAARVRGAGPAGRR